MSKNDRLLVIGGVCAVVLGLAGAGCVRSPIGTLARWDVDRWNRCVEPMMAYVGCTEDNARQRASLGVLVASAGGDAAAYGRPSHRGARLAFDPMGWCMQRKLRFEEYAAQSSVASRDDWLVSHGCPRTIVYRGRDFGPASASARRRK